MLYADLIDQIHRAKLSVQLMVYIWQDDSVGRQLEKALCAKAKQGIEIVLVVDAIGSYSLAPEVITRLHQSGIQVYIHHRIRLFRWAWLRYLIRRNHRKIFIIDSRIGYCGGFNVMAESSRKAEGRARWHDTMIRSTQNELVARLAQQFEDACRRARHHLWSRRLLTRSGNQVISVSRNRALAFSMSRWLKRRLRHARKQITICVPYFIPYGFYYRILKRKLRAGVSVKIILSLETDLPWIHAISIALARRLAKFGAEIYFFEGHSKSPRFSHAKLYEIDGWQGTGSANYDYRSFVLNLETLIFFRNAPRALQNELSKIHAGARRVSLAELMPGWRAWFMWPFRWLL